MKLMFVSDIHGSKYYCEKMLVKYMEEAPEKLILLGDLLYHGPRNDLPKEYDPKRVCTLLNLVKDNIICVQGNCDAQVDQMILDFPIMSEYAALFVDNFVMYITHGHTYNIENPLPINEHNIMIYGHTHVPLYEENSKGVFVNPGSVSIPKEGSEHSYMIYEDGVFTWKDLDGNEYMTRKVFK